MQHVHETLFGHDIIVLQQSWEMFEAQQLCKAPPRPH